MEAFSPISSAVLVDPDFGLPSLTKRDSHAGLLMSLEKSSYSIEDKDAVPLLNPSWSVKDIAEHGAAVKFVLFYHPQSANAQKKRELVEQIYADCKKLDVPFLFEVILHPLLGQKEEDLAKNHVEMQLQAVKDFTHSCDVLKLEFPLLPNEVLDPAAAADACKVITDAATVPWVILSKGMSFERYIRALEICMKNGASGFAVGRAVWKEIANIADSQDQYAFIRTTAVERTKKLIDIVEA
jgi:tagatose 1,6-diphosphate aldolase